MPARVRVTPFGSLIASSARGLLMGNRGCLHDAEGEVIREIAAYRGWVTCLLSFNGRSRQLRQAGRYTELFFLDEVTAMAAGHRPCGTCRRKALKSFLDCVQRGLGLEDLPKPKDVDSRLHCERIDQKAFRRGWPTCLTELPDGAMITRRGNVNGAWMWLRGRLYPWQPSGFGPAEPDSTLEDAILLTPPTIVAALRAGYRPILHPSAGSSQ